MERSLQPRRVMIKSVLGLASRGTQGLVLALAIPLLTVEAAGHLALVIGLSATLNLVTNVGIPTLIIRYARTGGGSSHLDGLARGYAWLTGCGSLLALGLTYALSGSPVIAVCCSLLAFGQSAFAGLEYWRLGAGNRSYDHFLRRGYLPQALLALLAPAILVGTRSASLCVLAMAGSYLLGGVLAAWGSHRLNPRFWFGAVELRSWWREAAYLGSVTLLTTCFYSIDLFVVSLNFPEQLIDYRLALYAVGFFVTFIPVNFFALSDAASGIVVRSRLLALAGGVLVTLSLAASAFMILIDDYYSAGVLLAILSGLALVRLVMQVNIAQLNALGGHRAASVVMCLSVLAWAAVAACVLLAGQGTRQLAVAQVAVELVAAAGITVALRRRVVAAGA